MIWRIMQTEVTGYVGSPELISILLRARVPLANIGPVMEG